jgi:hypothetical protein
VRLLCADLVELKCGEQADDRLGDTCADVGQRLMFRHRPIGKAVDASRNSLKSPRLVQLDQKLWRHALLAEICRTQQTLCAGKIEDPVGRGARHVMGLIGALVYIK